MDKINVKSSSGEYPVFIGEGSIEKLPGLTEGNFDKILIITDTNILQLYTARITYLQKKLNTQLLVLRPGEKRKSLSTVSKVVNLLAAGEYTRSSLIIALGGGVIGDLSGFAASVYMRGINIIHIPTTLLSAVDSSVGGKTGVNYKDVKNLLGTFYNPKYVLVDPSFLKTLPDDEFASGMGEVIKYAFLSGGKFYNQASTFSNIKKDDGKTLSSIIFNCLWFKASIVEKDEKDTGLRALLNFGHTFGHAYESASGFRIKHGAAVAMGICSSLSLSRTLNLISDKEFHDYLENVLPFISVKKPWLDENDVLNFMRADKKNRAGKLNFVLLKEPGLMLLNIKAEKKEILSSIRKTLAL